MIFNAKLTKGQRDCVELHLSNAREHSKSATENGEKAQRQLFSAISPRTPR